MFWAILGTIISKISGAFYVKTVQYKIGAIANEFFTIISAFFGILIIIILGKFNIFLNSYIDYFLILLSLCIYLFKLKLDKIVYEKEKISTLIPYENIGKIATVFGGIFLLGEKVSLTSIIIFLITIIIILLGSVQKNDIKFSKTILIYIISKLLSSVEDIIVGYILIKNSPLDYYTSYLIFCFGFLFLVGFYNNEFKDINNLNKKYFLYNFINGFSRIAWLASILLISEVGISISIMLSFLGIGISLLLSYLMFRDIPSKKNIFITILVTTLVILGFLLS